MTPEEIAALKEQNAMLKQLLQQQQQPKHSKWMSFFHALAVIAPVGAAAFSIYSGSPMDINKAQQTAQLVQAVSQALSGAPAA